MGGALHTPGGEEKRDSREGRVRGMQEKNNGSVSQEESAQPSGGIPCKTLMV